MSMIMSTTSISSEVCLTSPSSTSKFLFSIWVSSVFKFTVSAEPLQLKNAKCQFHQVLCSFKKVLMKMGSITAQWSGGWNTPLCTFFLYCQRTHIQMTYRTQYWPASTCVFVLTSLEQGIHDIKTWKLLRGTGIPMELISASTKIDITLQLRGPKLKI